MESRAQIRLRWIKILVLIEARWRSNLPCVRGAEYVMPTSGGSLQAESATVTGERMTLAAACLGMLTLGVNGTAIMAALPTMGRDLGLSASQLEWAINAYLIVSAACIIAGGKMCDQFGARRVSMAGLALFAVAAVVVATAQGPAALLVGRGLQGLAAALSVPGTLAAVNAASPPERRASAIGSWAGFLMLGFSLGPLIGGTLTHSIDWRVIFWASGITMLAAAGGFVVQGRHAGGAPGARHARRFDWAGFGLLAIFMAALVSALHALPTLTTAPAGLLGYGALAAAALVTLLKVERAVANPLIDLSLFRQAAFVRVVALAAIAMSCILSLLLFYNLEAQSPTGLGLTAIDAGLSLLPMSGGLLVFAFAAPSLVRRFGPRRVLGAGTLLIAAAGAGIAIAVAWQSWVPLLIGLFAIGMGLALPYATAPRLALATLPASSAGAGSGIINACTFLAGSIGVAAGAVVFAMGGLPGVMALIAALALLGVLLCRGLPAAS
jgi:MFS family permease